MLPILGCRTRAAHEAVGPQEPLPLTRSTAEQSKVEQIKGLYLTLADQLKSSPNPDAQSLAGMATAAANTPNDQMQAYIDSGHAKALGTEISTQKTGGQETPALLSDSNIQIAAISMITLSSVALLSSLSPRPLLGRGCNVGTLAISIAGLVIGTNLLKNPNDPKIKDQAQKLTLSAGIIALIFGVANVGLELVKKMPAYQKVVESGKTQLRETFEVQARAFRGNGNTEMATRLEEELPKRLEAVDNKTKFKASNVLWAAATIVIGSGLIVASQTAFNLADEPQTPQQTLAKINQLMTSN